MKSMTETTLLEQARSCLAGLIESSYLDARVMAGDCLEVFGDYEWAPLPGLSETNLARWEQLHALGVAGEMNGHELGEFISITDKDTADCAYIDRIKARETVDLIDLHLAGIASKA